MWAPVSQPLRVLHTAAAASFVVAHFPLWLLFYIPPPFRQRPAWTYRQALVTTLLKVFLRNFSISQPRSPLSLDPGAEMERFVVVEPGPSSIYTGSAVDAAITPARMGSTWYPTVYSGDSNGFVVLHFHGGAYVMVDGRSDTCGYIAHVLQEHAGAAYVFCPQYRLAQNPGGRFPAPLQDAITAYAYLVHTPGIPVDRIVISGDSAGGHLALMLLRYIAESAMSVLPRPRCACLFSPWTNVAESVDAATWTGNSNYRSDYIPARFAAWGACASLGDGMDEQHPYASPARHPFPTPCPLFVQTGESEVFCTDNKKLVSKMAAISTPPVELHVEDNTPHDIVMMANIMGFEQEARRCMEMANAFIRSSMESANRTTP